MVLVILNLGRGTLQEGFHFVTVQLQLEGNSKTSQFQGSLPAAPNIIDLYRRWQLLYDLIYSARSINIGLRLSQLTDEDIKIDEADVTHVSDADFSNVCEELQNQIDNWLDTEAFRNIDRQLRMRLSHDDEIRVIIQTEDNLLRKLPWHIWRFFRDYRLAEVALSPIEFEPESQTKSSALRVRILAILGDSTGIDTDADKKLLSSLSDDVETVFLVEPKRHELDEQLWDKRGWDILFFAGHSHSRNDGETGHIYINPTESLTIPQFKNALKKAIECGLQLAIFNSCDGLGLAQQLDDLHIPQMIVMREPVPDKVAQEFLKRFLRGFADGKSFYLAVREAREQLQGLENEFPGASWLPVICQNPAELPPRWIDLGGTPRCPYKGLSAFRQEDKSVFFGREAFTQRLLEAVKKKPLVAVIGPSGRGKSSVVFAGLIPYLLKEPDNWQIAHFRPGKRPLDALAAALLTLQSTQAVAGNEGEPQINQAERVSASDALRAIRAACPYCVAEPQAQDSAGALRQCPKGTLRERPLGSSELEHRLFEIHQLATELRSNKDTLTQFIARISSTNPKSIVLVADQFEELYTLCPDFEERESFLDCVLGAVYNAPCFKLVLTLRSDFYGYAQSYRAFNDALENNCLNLGPMNEQELGEAIAHPAYSLGVTLETGLIERILNDVGKKTRKQAENSQHKSPPDKLPLLEFALKQLWTEAIKHRTRQLTNQAYDEIGGIQEALGKYAKEVYDKIAQEYHPKQIRRVFTQLVRPGETTGTEDTRRLATRQEIGEENWELVTRLNSEDMRLVVIGYEEATSEETVEVVHEALILGWGRLREWMKSDRTFRTWQERLRGAMRQWEVTNNDEGALLHGASLAEAEDWLQQRREEVSPSERVFIELSLGLRDRLRREEQERRQRELEQERKARKAAQTRTGVAIASTILVSAAAIFAINQWNQVQKQYKNAALQAESKTASGILQLDGLIENIKVGKKLRQLIHSGEAEPYTRIQIVTGLLKAVYDVREQNRLIGHKAQVIGVSFSPDGQTIASAGFEHTVKLWKRNGSLLTTLTGHKAWVINVSFSPDRQTIASASSDHTVKLWKRDGSLLTTLTGHQAPVTGVSFSPDRQTIASASYDKTVKLWKQDGNLIATLTGHQAPVTGVSFSPDGQTIASASFDKTVKLWRRDGTLITTLIGQKSSMTGVSFSPDGQTIASTSVDNTVKLWRRDGSLLTTFTGHKAPVNFASFSPDGQTIASTSVDQTVKLWRRDGRLITTLTGHKSTVTGVSFSPDGQTIASGSMDHTVKLWRRDSSLMTTLTGQKSPMIGVSISQDGRIINSASVDNTVKPWRWDGRFITTFTVDKARVIGVSFSPDGQTIASASVNNTVKLWRRDGTLITTLTGHKAPVIGVSFGPDGQTIASTSFDKTVKLWRRDGTLITTLTGQKAPVIGVSFSPDGQTIASASYDKTLKLWRRDGSLINTLTGHSDWVNSVSFSPDGQTIASASNDKTIKLWKRDGSLINTLTGHSNWVNSVSFSPDGQTIASASNDTTVKLWRRDGSLINTLTGHNAQVIDVSFSRDGQTIASASLDNTIKLWRRDGSLMTTLTGHNAPVVGVSFSPDGQMLASAGVDGKVILWNFNLDDLLRRGCNWAREYLKNPNNGMSKDDPQRRICDDIN
ncbi:eIF2A-related protein [Scytonema sp. PCC 10023]|uniref:nSTAND1 domain-containing NTPase n=1 Tax=Scytonema sp. PCC 10023 TaxID=1680591 RepID=UPI0039C6A5EF